MAILARLLTPEDFGLVAMVVVVVTFISAFKDMGLSMATVQRPEVTHGQVSTLFWVNVGLSGAVVVITMALAPVLAWFYKEPRLEQITLVLALTVVFGGLTVQHQALLRRQMRFGALAVVEIVSMVSALTVAVVMASSGFGYWSIVVMPIVREATITAGVWTACQWRPGPPVRRSGVRLMLAFGGYLTAFNLVNYFARNLDKMLIGWQFGAIALGFYSKAYQLLLLPMQQINAPLTTVAVPALSRLQDQFERYRAYYIRGGLLTTTIGMPIVAFLLMDADLAVLTILGNQWGESVPIFRALGPAALIGTFNVATGWVYISTGRTKRMFKWGMFGAAIVVIAYLIGLRWGTLGVAWSFSVSVIVLRLPSFVYCFRGTHMRLIDPVRAIWRPSTAAIIAAAIFYGFQQAIPMSLPGLARLAIDLAVYMTFYIILWVALPGGRVAWHQTLQLMGDLRRSRGQTDPGTSALNTESKTDV